MDKTPVIFMTYSHDTEEHKQWVLNLATKLMDSGVEVILDLWDLKPGDDLVNFMSKNLKRADKILMVCTSKYVEKANTGKGGVGYERMIMTSEYLKDINSTKVIPLIKQKLQTTNVPIFMETKMHINFSRDEEFEFSFDDLIRHLHDAPVYEKPKLGTKPFEPRKAMPPKKTNDPLRTIIKTVVQIFESQSTEWISYEEIVKKSEMSRIYLDLNLNKLVDDFLLKKKEFIHRKGYVITDEGKKYAIENGLVKE